MKSGKSHSTRHPAKNLLFLFSILLLIHGLSGCFTTWAPSDDEAVHLLKNYYSYYEEKGIEAEIVNRGEYIKECDCYPIEFKVSGSEKETHNRTFYFYKNGSGAVEIKKFKFGMESFS